MADFEPDDRDHERPDERPRRRERRDEDDSRLKPKSNTPLILGIVAGVFVLFGLCVCAPIGIGLLLPAVQKVREAANAKQKSNNLKQIGLAARNHESIFLYFPNNTPRKDALNQQPLTPVNPTMPILEHSWRIQLLPFMEAESAFKQYDLTKPWSDPQNAAVGAIRIAAYAADDPRANTRYFGFAGYGTMLEPNAKITMPSITDGTSNTILYAQFDTPGPWHMPNDPMYHVANAGPFGGAMGPVPPLPAIFSDGTKPGMVLMADGSVKRIQPGIDPAVFMAFVGRRDGSITNNALLEAIP